MKEFYGDTAGSIYMEMVREVLNRGKEKSPRGMKTLELHPVHTTIRNAAYNKFILLKDRGINYAFALAEVIWILSGKGDAGFIKFYNSKILDYLDGDALTFHGSYGLRIRQAGSHLAANLKLKDGVRESVTAVARYSRVYVDQLQAVHDKLVADPDSRQAVVTLWDPIKDNLVVSKDYPCNIALMFSVEDGALDLHVVRRSNDLVLGYPYNIIQFTSIQEYLAGWLGMRVGVFYETINSLHIYLDLYPSKLNKLKEMVSSMPCSTLSFPVKTDGNSEGVANYWEMSKILNFFLTQEIAWRRVFPNITPEGRNRVAKGEIKIIDDQVHHDYWNKVVKFLLAYHLYKVQAFQAVHSIISSLHDERFELMAEETFTAMYKG